MPEERSGLPWPPEELEQARRMRRRGLGSTAIANALGRSRNAVIGVLWREGEPGVLKCQSPTVTSNRTAAPRRMSWEEDACG